MKIGQTAVVGFLAKFLGSILGFVGTIYFAQKLGANVLGTYSLIIALTGWLSIAGNLGIGNATIKRVSEGTEQGSYLSASIILLGILTSIILFSLFIGHHYVEEYISDFGSYSTISVVWFIAILVVVDLLNGLVRVVLSGLHLVHVSAILKPVQIGFKTIIQVLLVIIGYSLVGILVGNILATILVAILGVTFISIRPSMPDRSHFIDLIDYAKYSWLGSIKSRAYNDADIVILGVFVTQSLIGVYSVTWTIVKFVDMFGSAVSSAIFPEISKISAEESETAIVALIEDALAYTGIVAIPGLVGGSLLADRLFEIYGSEFNQGTEVLPLLLVSMTFYTYLQQFLNGLNGIDMPNVSFKINMVFLSSNVLLNLALVWYIGWVGAAIASALSTLIGLCIAYFVFDSIVEITVPTREIGKQIIASLCMGAIVWTAEWLADKYEYIQYEFVTTVGLVAVGATSYVLILIFISDRFRQVVQRNLPIQMILKQFR